jgi:tRNA(Ile)-lysidine synthase
MDLELKVERTARKYGMFERGERVLIGVSGGPDSVSLLHALVAVRANWGLELEVAHLEHGIRGPEAREDARLVSRLAEQFLLRFHLRRIDLPGVRAAQGRGNLEAMARKARYDFFTAIAKERSIRRVATAHTRDDQVETFLMWLLRGSGVRGLSAMPPVRRFSPDTADLWLVRPLLEISRREILDYLAAKSLSYRIDHTNHDPGRLRNWIRIELLPRLRERLDMRLDERLSRTADLLRDDDELLNRLASERLDRAVRDGALERDKVLEESRAMQRRLVRRWLEGAKGDLRGVGFDHAESMLDLIANGPPQGRLSMPAGWEFVKEYGWLRLEKRPPLDRVVSYSYRLPEEGNLVIPEAGLTLQCTRRSGAPTTLPGDNRQALFDLGGLPEELTVRNFRPGDRFHPLGTRGRKKVKNLFIEKRVPRSVRSTLPLLVAGGEVLWIPRCGRSGLATVGPATRAVLLVKLVAGEG